MALGTEVSPILYIIKSCSLLQFSIHVESKYQAFCRVLDILKDLNFLCEAWNLSEISLTVIKELFLILDLIGSSITPESRTKKLVIFKWRILKTIFFYNSLLAFPNCCRINIVQVLTSFLVIDVFLPSLK